MPKPAIKYEICTICKKQPSIFYYEEELLCQGCTTNYLNYFRNLLAEEQSENRAHQEWQKRQQERVEATLKLGTKMMDGIITGKTNKND